MDLRNSLANTGGNLVPVYVRPEGERFALAYGVLRPQACIELGLPLLAVVDAHLTEHELVAAMLAEARVGTPLSDYELGTAVQGMLEGGLWPSKRRAADALGLQLSHLNGALAVAQLPSPVLAAFDWPTAIRPIWVSKLLATYERYPAGFPQRVTPARAGKVSAANARSICPAITAAE